MPTASTRISTSSGIHDGSGSSRYAISFVPV